MLAEMEQFSKKMIFWDSKIINVSFQYCCFSDTIFQNCPIKGSNFANSTFAYCAIQDSTIHGCSFVGAELYSSILRDTKITSSTFELCRFRNMLFENLDLKQLTLNYTFFENVKMKNVCLPFMQIPYTFNGLQYVFNTSDNVTISSHSYFADKLKLEEYKDMLEDFIVFFNEKNQYFPLANCYIVNNELEKAITCNETGIRISASTHDFRTLYFYCIQAAEILKISREKRGLLYSEINAILSEKELSGGEYHQFYLYFPLIKKLLFDTPHNNPIMTLTIRTNIDSCDYDRLSILLSALEEASNACGISLDSKHIEIRHNSPNVVDYFLSGQLQNLIVNLHNTYNMLQPIISDLANVITICGVAGKAGKYIYNKINKEDSNTSVKNETYTNKRTNNKSLFVGSKKDLLKINKLRKEIYQCYKNNGEGYEQSPLLSVNKENSVSEKIIATREKLKKSDIQILSMEIQFLEMEKMTLLDNLYKQEIRLMPFHFVRLNLPLFLCSQSQAEPYQPHLFRSFLSKFRKISSSLFSNTGSSVNAKLIVLSCLNLG